jgi:hypothetical protein
MHRVRQRGELHRQLGRLVSLAASLPLISSISNTSASLSGSLAGAWLRSSPCPFSSVAIGST